MDTKPNEWTEESSDIFIRYGKYFIPESSYQSEIIARLIPSSEKEMNILDICCGEGRLCKELLDKHPSAIVHGLDGSAKMLEEASRNLKEYGERFIPEKINIFDKDWRMPVYKVSSVVSSLAIHHLDDNEKQELFKDIYESLVPGGAFIIADLVMPLTNDGMHIAAETWNDIIKETSEKHDTEIYNKFRSSGWNYFEDALSDPMDKPSTLFDQMKWLQEAGFKGIDVYWFKAGHAVFGGYKNLLKTK